MEESSLVVGRISRDELEYRLGFDGLFSQIQDPTSLTADQVTELRHQVYLKFARIHVVCLTTYAAWLDCGFQTGYNVAGGSHGVGANLWLQEAGVYAREPTGQLPDIEKISKEIDRRALYIEAFQEDFFPIERNLKELQSSSTMTKIVTIGDSENITQVPRPVDEWQDMSTDQRATLISEFCSNITQLYESYVNLILKHLPGRTFLNRL